MQRRQPVDLLEVDQAVEDGHDVVRAEDERVEHAGRDELQPAVEVVELRERQEDEPQQDDPRLPPVELVRPVHDRAHQQLDGRFGHEQGVC